VLAAGAVVLWTSSVVPGNLKLSGLDQHRYFSAHVIDRAESFGRFTFFDGVLALIAVLVVLAAYARWGARWMRESAAGRIGTGMLLGMIGLAFTWFAQIPFGVAQLWWERRHGLAQVGYVEYVVDNWLGLAGEFLFICFALLIVMALARPLGDRWWMVGGPFFVGLALLFAFVQPYLIPNLHRLRDPQLAASARVLERREGVAATPIEVQDVSSLTSAPNAEATGMGPSRRVVLWNTLLDGRFSNREIRVVIAHELGHLARSHIWKLIAWYAVFAIPGAFLIARFTRRRGGMARPEAVPLGLFVFVALGTLALPAQNMITRHIEAEADWMALQAARDPTAQRSLMQEFTSTSLEEPDPGFVEYVLFENHPTVMQRIAMVEAWKKRQATSAAQSP
jgi:STE24 endopeptidase